VKRSVLAFAFVAALLAPAQAARHPVRRPRAARLAFVDSMYAYGRAAQADALLDSTVAAAQAAGDRATEIEFATRRASAWVFYRRYDDAVREAGRVVPIARALRDTLTWARALLVQGRAHLFRERDADAGPPYRQLLPLARALHDPQLEGNARLGLAYLDLQAGHAIRAERGYRAATRLLTGGPEVASEMAARIGLARVLRLRGDLDGARATYRAVIDRARAIGDPYDEADAWNNLGVIETGSGDPSRAVAYVTRALTLNRRTGRASAAQVQNLAILLMEQGHYEEAASQIEAELARAPGAEHGRRTYELTTQLAIARLGQGRAAESERLLRTQWAVSDSFPVASAVNAGSQLARLLVTEERWGEALALLSEIERRHGPRCPRDMVVPLAVTRADAERGLGRPGAALAAVEALEASIAASNGLSAFERLQVELVRAQAHADLGAADSAFAALRRATEAWEIARGQTRSAEWLEAIGHNAGRLALQTARLLLDPRRGGTEDSRAREAFDALQRFKGRSLEFRLAARDPAGSKAWLPGTAARLQHEVLHRDEILLDYYEAQGESLLVIAVDRGAVRASWLGRYVQTVQAIDRFRDLVDAAPRDAGTLEPGVARAQGRLLFGPALERVRAARRVLVSPAARLRSVPFGLAGVEEGRDDPLCATREVAIVPSATWLGARRAGPAIDVAGARLVRLARSTGPGGRELPGVASESQWLARRYGGEGLLHRGERTLASILPALGRGDVLHLAAHTRAAGADPWSSALLLGRGDDEAAWLTARDVASRRVAARLVVLASCNTSLGGRLELEGTAGLSSGFLAAGVPAVVTTLWSVDDRATSEFVHAFYRHLERGEAAAAALGSAQRELAARPAMAAPYYWAGFVLAGDPDLRVRLKPLAGAKFLSLP
jgi:tetratricopeptide (TPR) repeat protein